MSIYAISDLHLSFNTNKPMNIFGWENYEEKIKQAIEEIKENHTIITIAHRLNTIENADCIYVVDNGFIAESGTHDELIAGNGIYKRLYDTKDEVSYE